MFLCGARDFHAMDWYKSAKENHRGLHVSILTDIIVGEGFERLITSQDKVAKLIILDNFLFKSQSSVGNIWRNFVKLIALPFQVILLRKFYIQHPSAFFHAHSMYYLWLAWLANVPFIGTPQGSDILIKPYRSKIFKWLSVRSMQCAIAVTVDSEKMSEGVKKISDVSAHIIQNGIDIKAINLFFENKNDKKKERILSLRGFTQLYRIDEIVKIRNLVNPLRSITFIYPFFENTYRDSINLKVIDLDLGRVSRLEMYKILSQTQLVISIPYSDSSPRSVYESIFCGSTVAITYNLYYESLPICMKKRIIIVDLEDNNWLNKALLRSEEIIKEGFSPSEDALDLFDQRRSFEKIFNLLPN